VCFFGWRFFLRGVTGIAICPAIHSCSDFSEQKHDEQDDEHETQNAAWKISPIAAVRQSGDRSQKEKEKDNEKNGSD
jgi:hypothetical protein